MIACARAMRFNRSSTPIGGTSPRIELMPASSFSAVDPPTPVVIVNPFGCLSRVLKQHRHKQRGEDPPGRDHIGCEMSRFMREVHRPEHSPAKSNRDVHDRADPHLEQQGMIAERRADAVCVGGDEYFAAIEHNISPRGSLLWLAAARRIF